MAECYQQSVCYARKRVGPTFTTVAVEMLLRGIEAFVRQV